MDNVSLYNLTVIKEESKLQNKKLIQHVRVMFK